MQRDDGLIDRRDLLAEGIERPDRDVGAGYRRERRGVYGPPVTDRESPEDRYLVTVQAASHTLEAGSIFSHESAAVAHGIPVMGPWPDTVHLVTDRRNGGRSQLDVVRHCLGLEAVRDYSVGGLHVTSPARTAFDIALSRSFEQAVVVADATFRLFPEARDETADLMGWFGRRRGWRKARRALTFASGAAGSVGESRSRVRIHTLGFAAPVLQFEIVTGSWHEFADFAWPDVRAVGEFDGEVKYREDRYRRGGSAEDVVIREKNRENRMRRVMPRFARWDMRDVREPWRLERILLEAGIPRTAQRLAR